MQTFGEFISRIVEAKDIVEILREVDRIARRHGTEAYLFGSVAEGHVLRHESDVDIAIVGNIRDAMKARKEIEERLLARPMDEGLPPSLPVFTRERWEKFRKGLGRP